MMRKRASGDCAQKILTKKSGRPLPGVPTGTEKRAERTTKRGMACQKGKQETKTVHTTAALQAREGPQDRQTKRRATGASTGKSYGGKG